MPLISTRGAASAQGFGEFAQSAAVNYIEDVFSTYLYTGNGSTQTITNGIDLSGKGGLVWMKGRSGATDHALYDTTRGATKDLVSNSTAAETTQSTGLTAFSGTGFSIGALAKLNTNAATYASWTFRKAEKFFDVVTWTGNNSTRQIAHSLGSVPGCIVVKCTSEITNWPVYHRSLGASADMRLNTTAAQDANNIWANTSPTSTNFTVSGNAEVNGSGRTYVAYIFAHNAGGFGLSGTDNVISCGSFTTDASGNFSVNLGYEAQWVLVKSTDFIDSWYLIDVMRGMSQTSTNTLRANTSGAETAYTQGYCAATATGFASVAPGLFTGSKNFIYIAIRRGPMKVPTSGTSVYQPSTYTGNDTGAREITGLSTNPDLMLNMMRDPSTSGSTPFGFTWFDRLRGRGNRLNSSNTSAAASLSPATEGPGFFSYFVDRTTGESNYSPATYISYLFRRAPGFMDVVCWTGVAGTAQQISHNLAAVPELIITKRRDAVSGWPIYNKTITATNYLILQDGRASAAGSTFWNNTEPTSSVFTAGQTVSPTGGTIVAYLFATVAGVSKVGSYTGSGTTKQIDCGFTAGARFVLIKRTDSTGDWYVWDSARGIVASTDPYLVLNSTAAEVTTTDWVDTYSAGFELSSAAGNNVNINAASYIFLSIS